MTRRALPHFSNPKGVFNCFISVVLHLFWQSSAFVQWLLDLQANEPKVVAGELSP